MKRIQCLFVTVILTLAGCANLPPIQNVENTPITYNLEIDQVKQAIIDAGKSRDWVMYESTSGVLRGELLVRSHVAIVDVTYTDKMYSIKYVSSENLNQRDGLIHTSYNRWIENLNLAIRKNLLSSAHP